MKLKRVSERNESKATDLKEDAEGGLGFNEQTKNLQKEEKAAN